MHHGIDYCNNGVIPSKKRNMVNYEILKDNDEHNQDCHTENKRCLLSASL